MLKRRTARKPVRLVTRALTHDRHFEPAGFKALLRERK